jgi:hypothetical protein
MEFLNKIIAYFMKKEKNSSIENLMGNPEIQTQMKNMLSSIEKNKLDFIKSEKLKKEIFKKRYEQQTGKKYSDKDFWTRPEVMASYANNQRSNDSNDNSNNERSSCSSSNNNDD